MIICDRRSVSKKKSTRTTDLPSNLMVLKTSQDYVTGAASHGGNLSDKNRLRAPWPVWRGV